MAKYEILYIIRPNIEEEAKNALLLNQKIGKNVVLHTKSKISVKDFTTLLTLKQKML